MKPPRRPKAPSSHDRADQARPRPPRTGEGRGPGFAAGGRGASPARLRATPEMALIWGFHAALEALRSPRRTVVGAIVTEAAAERLAPELAARGVTPEILGGSEIDARLPGDAVHQGVVLKVRPLPDLDLGDIPDEGTVLVLDQITDPHNVGAILRTAAAFSVAALITTERHTPELTGVLAKSASGGLEHVPIVGVVNLARTLDTLRKRGFTAIGLDSEGPVALEETDAREPLALVLGAEGKGLRRLTRERCDVLARLDMPGAIKSLNVSNACAVALATLRLRRG